MELVTGHKGQNHVTSAQDARRNQGIFGGSFILDGMDVSISGSTASVSAGYAVINGRLVECSGSSVSGVSSELYIVFTFGGNETAEFSNSAGGDYSELFATFADGEAARKIAQSEDLELLSEIADYAPTRIRDGYNSRVSIVSSPVGTTIGGSPNTASGSGSVAIRDFSFSPAKGAVILPAFVVYTRNDSPTTIRDSIGAVVIDGANSEICTPYYSGGIYRASADFLSFTSGII